MSVRPGAQAGRVVAQEQLSDHLVRVTVGELGGFVGTGVPDEWVALTVPGQFQTRYYTVRSWDPSSTTMVLDVVVHAEGLVTEWVRTDCVGDEVGISPAKGSFAVPEDAGWVVLAGDLTALPAVARILESGLDVPVTAYLEAPEPVPGYLPEDAGVTWVAPPAPEASGLADLVHDLTWPAGPGYFWMAGESAQMRQIRAPRPARARLGLPPARRDGLLVRHPRTADPRGRPRPDLRPGQGRRQVRRADLGRVRRRAR